jgi:hypothetical protein
MWGIQYNEEEFFPLSVGCADGRIGVGCQRKSYGGWGTPQTRASTRARYAGTFDGNRARQPLISRLSNVL